MVCRDTQWYAGVYINIQGMQVYIFATIMHTLLPGRSHAYCQGGVLLEDSEEVESMQKLKTDLKDHNIPAMCKTDTVDFTLPVTESLKDMYVNWGGERGHPWPHPPIVMGYTHTDH